MNREEEKPASVPSGDKQAGKDLWQRHGAQRGVWSESMLIALERGIKGNKWFSLIDKVRSERTLGIAWEKVRRNAGACGVDRISVEFFGKDSENRLLAVKEQLTENNYIPRAIQRVRIPKPGSAETRALVKERISDGKVLDLIEAFLKQGVMEEGVETEPEKGSPQGGVISPLLANIYLDPLDWLLKNLGIRSVRYADDIVILAENAGQAKQALRWLEEWMQEAGLILHPEKTRIVDMGEGQAHFDFLGYRFLRSKKGRLVRLVRPKSKQKLRSTLKPLRKRANGKSMEAIIASINPVLEGWFAYFRQACLREHQEMDRWMRVRLRSILRKRNKGEGKGRGKDHFKWPNCYFENLGLFSLEQAREEQMSLRRGANC